MKGIEEFFRANRGPVLFLVMLIVVIGAVAGLKYYTYTQEQPEYCSMCHMMQEAVKSWQRGPHRQYQCQICHNMGIFEQNKLLVAFVAGAKGISQKHGRVNPWDKCRTCHMDTVAQGSVTLRSSYGHAKHVFMKDIGCNKCHNGDLHAFNVVQAACLNCHSDKLVHGMGMEGLNCLNCHSYAESSPKMITPKRCLKCHKGLPASSPMSGLACFECHKPHGRLKMESDDCLGRCHGNESKVGQHGLHLNKARLACMECHLPHTWVVGRKEAQGLCNRCHPLRDPASFIY